MSYTEPVDFIANKPIRAEQINAMVNNINALKFINQYTLYDATQYSTTSGTPVNISGGAWDLTFTPTQEKLLVGISCTQFMNAGFGGNVLLYKDGVVIPNLQGAVGAIRTRTNQFGFARIIDFDIGVPVTITPYANANGSTFYVSRVFLYALEI